MLLKFTPDCKSCSKGLDPEEV